MSKDKKERACVQCENVLELPTGRRCFMAQSAAVALGAAAVAPAVLSAVQAVFSPLRTGGKSESDGAGKAYALSTFDSLPTDGTPTLYAISDDRQDGWTRYLDVPVGAVWVRRLQDGKVQAFQSICPHAGCPIIYDEKAGGFFCPCHAAAFTIDGARVEQGKPNPCPRDMDTLEAKVENGMVVVNYLRFREGCKEKVAEA